jgi:hypothetical protein
MELIPSQNSNSGTTGTNINFNAINPLLNRINKNK